ASASGWREACPAPESVAVLQYTSGSTGNPKGVMLTHAAILHNLQCIHEVLGLGPDTVGVSWLPAFHDMGLIGNLLDTLVGNFSLVLMSPATLTLEPFRWLQVISAHRASICGGPPFAFDLCVNRVTSEQRRQLD